MTSLTEDLTAALTAAGVPAVGAAVLRPDRAEEPGWVVLLSQGLRVKIDGPLTPVHLAAAATVLAAFDFTPAGVVARELVRNPERKTLRDQAAQAVVDIDAFLLIADVATAAQVRQATKRLAQMMRAVILRLTQID